MHVPVIDLNFAAHVWCTVSVAQIFVSVEILCCGEECATHMFRSEVYFLLVFSFNKQHFMDTV